MTGGINAVFRYLTNIWGALSGLSLLFPLSDLFLRLVPMDKAPLDHHANQAGLRFVSPSLAVAIATVTSLFVLNVLVFIREEIGNERRIEILKWSASIFGAAMLSLILYLVFYHDNYLGESWVQDDSFVIDFVLIGLYTGFFAGMSTAFTLIGLHEYGNTFE